MGFCMVENHDDQTPQGGTSLEQIGGEDVFAELLVGPERFKRREEPYLEGDIVYQREMHFGPKAHVIFHKVRVVKIVSEEQGQRPRRYLIEHAGMEEGTSYPHSWVTKRIGELENYLHPTLGAAEVAAYLHFKRYRDHYQVAMDDLGVHGVHKDEDKKEVWGIFWLKEGAEVDHAQNYTMTHATKDGKVTLCGLTIGRMAHQQDNEEGISCKLCAERMP